MSIGLYDPRRGEASVALERIRWSTAPYEPPRTNCFSVYWIESGAGSLTVDATLRPFTSSSLVFLSPYQRVRWVPSKRVRGAVIRFHANFLCVETFHAESGCSGILFNDPFGSPSVPLDARAQRELRGIVDRIDRELTDHGLGHDQVVVASLRILLVLATRLKGVLQATRPPKGRDHRHPLLERVTGLVEQHYRRLHAPGEYARLLNVTPKTLTRFARAQFGKTMTELVRERLLIDAKWDLLHTLKPVKAIAGELGFSDELYFSRMFKKATGRSPLAFREYETAIRGGSNLSMSLTGPPIPPRPTLG